MTENKTKWEITIDFLMIIGKYFESCNDYINVIKVNSKYKELLLMYKYNPISNCDLFPNIETQHFYVYSDIFYRKRSMFRYIYWIPPYLLESYFDMIDNSLCIVKNIYINKFLSFCKSMNFKIGKVYNDDLFNRIKTLMNGYIIFNYNNNYFGLIIKEFSFDTYPKSFKQCYFINDNILCNCDIFYPIVYKENKIFIREKNFTPILTICHQNNIYPTIELDNIYLMNFLPRFMIVTDYCIIDLD